MIGREDMARPRKNRMVCDLPEAGGFQPAERSGLPSIVLTVDEYETLRLIDREGLSQAQCGTHMGVARTTVQLIYASARKKVADALVEGRGLRIQGGEYQLCDGTARDSRCSGCLKCRLSRAFGKPKGEMDMRIAVTFDHGQIFQHFGHTEQFKLYDVADGKVASAQVVGTNGQGHGALAGVLKALGVDVLICGGIGGGARAALDAQGIRLYGGVTGEADRAVEALLAGKLDYDPQAHCDHHGQEHGGSHACAHHEGHGHGPCGQGCHG